MSRYTIIAVIAALCLTVASGAALSLGQNSASFYQPPSTIFNGATGAADETTWGAVTAVAYGPGADNTTTVSYGITYTTSQLTSVLVRNTNGSLISNGTADTTLGAKIGSDASYSTAITWTSSAPALGVGLGSIGIGFVALDTATVPCSQVWLAIISSAGALTVKKQITSYVCTATCSSTVTPSASYANTVTSVFYENATYYVAYATTTSTNAYVTANTACATSATQQVTAVLQGVGATSTGALSYTTAAVFFTGTAATTPAPTAAVLAPTCGKGNQTNSTSSLNFYCTYRSADTLVVTSYITITASTGAVGSAVAIATDTTTTAGTYPLTEVDFTPAGFVYSEYQTGILINNLTTVTATSGGTPTYTNTLQLYNLTSGATAVAGGVAISGWTNTYSGGSYSGRGITYGSGFATLIQWSSASATANSAIGVYFANGTMNGTTTVTTVASGATAGTAQWFSDAAGALWWGGYTYDDTTFLPLVGYVGKAVAYLYNAGNILASFFALLSVMVAALFAF